MSQQVIDALPLHAYSGNKYYKSKEKSDHLENYKQQNPQGYSNKGYK
ncbi:MAG: hypothetical protein ACFFG0_48010 [Candidatus Thorarchaeota archaeon]